VSGHVTRPATRRPAPHRLATGPATLRWVYGLTAYIGLLQNWLNRRGFSAG
jgi:hypothetical protein